MWHKWRQRWRHVPWQWRWVAYAVGIICAFYTVENIRGEFALRQYRKTCEARGEWFDEAGRRQARPAGQINLLSLPEAKPGFEGEGLYQYKMGDFDQTMNLEPNGIGACRPYPFHATFKKHPNLSSKEGAAKYLLASEPFHNDLDAFCQAVEEADCLDIPVLKNDDIVHSGITEISAIRNTLMGLRFRSTANIQTENFESAYRDIMALAKISEYMANADLLIVQLMGYSGRNMMAQPLWEGMKASAFSDDQYQAISQRLLAPIPPEVPFDTFMMERAIALKGLKASDSFPKRLNAILNPPKPPPGWGPLTGFLPKPTIQDRVLKFASNVWTCIVPDGWYKLWFIKAQEEFRAAGFPTSPPVIRPFYYAIWGTVYQGHGGLEIQRYKYIAISRLAGLAAANERYYLHHGKYAEKITDLVPEYIKTVPLDPFSGKDFIYLPAGARSPRPVIYSVGENLTDDGGYQFRNRRKGDIVWQYEFPKNFTIDHYKRNKFP